jgi:hypothetical protein
MLPEQRIGIRRGINEKIQSLVETVLLGLKNTNCFEKTLFIAHKRSEEVESKLSHLTDILSPYSIQLESRVSHLMLNVPYSTLSEAFLPENALPAKSLVKYAFICCKFSHPGALCSSFFIEPLIKRLPSIPEKRPSPRYKEYALERLEPNLSIYNNGQKLEDVKANKELLMLSEAKKFFKGCRKGTFTKKAPVLLFEEKFSGSVFQIAFDLLSYQKIDAKACDLMELVQAAALLKSWKADQAKERLEPWILDALATFPTLYNQKNALELLQCFRFYFFDKKEDMQNYFLKVLLQTLSKQAFIGEKVFSSLLNMAAETAHPVLLEACCLLLMLEEGDEMTDCFQRKIDDISYFLFLNLAQEKNYFKVLLLLEKSAPRLKYAQGILDKMKSHIQCDAAKYRPLQEIAKRALIQEFLQQGLSEKEEQSLLESKKQELIALHQSDWEREERQKLAERITREEGPNIRKQVAIQLKHKERLRQKKARQEDLSNLVNSFEDLSTFGTDDDSGSDVRLSSTPSSDMTYKDAYSSIESSLNERELDKDKYENLVIWAPRHLSFNG